jgi:hypothetical protein
VLLIVRIISGVEKGSKCLPIVYRRWRRTQSVYPEEVGEAKVEPIVTLAGEK